MVDRPCPLVLRLVMMGTLLVLASTAWSMRQGVLIPSALAGEPALAGPAAARQAPPEPATAFGGKPIRFRLGAQDQVDRIVLECDQPFTVTRAVDGDDLLYRFDRPLKGEAGRIAVVLGGSILSATARGTTLRLRLRQGIEAEEKPSSPRRLILEFREHVDEPVLDEAAANDPAGKPAGDAPPGLQVLSVEDPVAGRGSLTPADALTHAGPPAGFQQAQNGPDGWQAGPRLPIGAPLPAVDAALSISAQPSGDHGVAVDYRWDQPVAAAAFVRDDRLWVTFAAGAGQIRSDAPALARQLGGRVLDAERQPLRHALVFRFQLASHVRPRFEPVEGSGSESVWRLTLDDGDEADPQPPAARLMRPVLVGEALRFAVPGPALHLADPRAGDQLIVLAANAATAAPGLAGSFTDVEVLPSLAGIVLRPLRPQIIAEPDGFGVLVQRSDHQGLVLSDGRALAGGDTGAMLDFVRFGSSPGLADLRAVQAAQAASPDDPRRRADLIRTLLALALVEEAKVAISTAPSDRRFLQPLANVADALSDPAATSPGQFSAVLPTDYAEAALWQAYLLAIRQDWPASTAALLRSGDVLRQYPPALRRILTPVVVGAQIMTGDSNAALATLDGILSVAQDDGELAMLNLLQGQALAAEDSVVPARRKIADATARGDIETRLAAQGAGIDLDLREGGLDAATANARLSELAPSWEGRQEEIAMETRHLNVAMAADDWITALSAADRLASLHMTKGPGSRETSVRAVLAKALAAPGLDPFHKLALLRGRSADLLHDAQISSSIEQLAAEMSLLGQETTAQALRDSILVPEPTQPALLAGAAHDFGPGPDPATLSTTSRRLATMAETPELAVTSMAPELASLLNELGTSAADGSP